MTFGESIRTCFTKYADFNGRASRSEFWWFFLFCILAGIAVSFISDALHWLFIVGTLLPSFAVGARRLHDTDRSGWFQLLLLIPFIGFIILVVLWVQEPKATTQYDAPNEIIAS